jgi:hypothetical protein
MTIPQIAEKPISPIDYRYLNMDAEQFEENMVELVKSIGKGAKLVSAENFTANQILIAGGHKKFGKVDAIQLCRKLSGLDRFGNKLKDHP